jgi:hypothetical protein
VQAKQAEEPFSLTQGQKALIGITGLLGVGYLVLRMRTAETALSEVKTELKARDKEIKGLGKAFAVRGRQRSVGVGTDFKSEFYADKGTVPEELSDVEAGLRAELGQQKERTTFLETELARMRESRDDLLADLRAGYVHTITMTDLAWVDRAKMQEKRRMTSETQSLLVPPPEKKRKRRKTEPPSPQTSDDEGAASHKRRKTKHSKSDPESRESKPAKSLPSIPALEEPPQKRQHETAEPSESPLVPKEEQHDNQDPA